ncbi:MAG: hypothetical protein F4Z63_00310 [Gammaproteobacteria bacterium]|nr:hypothetical protein [Gammaproteobacteria bacterium]MYE62010.1 hypothetical protein [Rhodothermaceae bacterium]MYJ19497.1 hypothetical protein [Rhodothermaceae bacterium]
MPRSAEIPIGVFPIEVSHVNKIIASEKSYPIHIFRAESYPGTNTTKKSNFNFSEIDPIVHLQNQPIYIAPSLIRNSQLSTKELWIWIHNLTDYICEDINKANARVLQRVKGIGRAKALAIIAYRDKHGPFQSLDELMKVRGIGSATVENFRAAGFCVKETSSAPKRQNNQPPPQSMTQ